MKNISEINYFVGDLINGTLNTFTTKQEAENCYEEYVTEGNRINAENEKECIGQDIFGVDMYPIYPNPNTFYYFGKSE